MSSLTTRLPPPVRRRLGRYKRALLHRAGLMPIPTGQAPRPEAPVAVANSAVRTPAWKPTPAERLQLRRDSVFATADRAGRLLEIGAAHNGILPKREGFNTKIVDYLDRDGLVHKYSTFEQYSADDIEEVDFVLSSGAALTDVIHEQFDLVLASHVLEHTTCLITFLNDATRLLADGGVLALVVPDHRYCFDRFRERSALGRVIDTQQNPPKVHTVGTLTEFSLNAVRHRGTTSWVDGHAGRYSLVHTLGEVRRNAEKATSGEYVDVHNWIFSPHHLRLLLDDLHTLGLIQLREAHFRETVGHEFFLNLTVDGPGTGLSREQLLVLADAELTSLDLPEFETV